jgi:hypothetical protein
MSNVRDFGAAGDGERDDTDAIKHALVDGDGELEFSPGTYRVTSSILIDLAKLKRVAIHGSGGTAKLIMAGAGPLFDVRGTHAKTADPLGFKPEIWERERLPTFANFEIEGAHAEADGIRVVGAMQPTFTGVLIRRVRHGIHIQDRCRNVLISHCHIYHNTGCGVFLDRVNLHQTNIVGSHISYNRLGGVRIENSEIRNLQITGNDIEYNNNAAHKFPAADALATAEIYIDCGETGTVREMTIASNTLQATYSPNGCNLRIIGFTTPEQQRAGMCSITGNLIGSQETNIHLTSCRGVVLEGNYIYSGHRRNLLLESSRNLVIGSNCLGHNPDYKEKELCTGVRLVDCEFVTLTGLQVQDAQAGQNTVTGAIAVARQGLVELVRCQRVNLTGVQIFEGSPFALYLDDCQDTLISGCTLLDTRATPLTQRSIEWVGPSRGSMIHGCRLNRGVNVPAGVLLKDLIES